MKASNALEFGAWSELGSANLLAFETIETIGNFAKSPKYGIKQRNGGNLIFLLNDVASP